MRPLRLATVVALAALLVGSTAALAQPAEGAEGVHLAFGTEPTTVIVTFSGPPAAEALVEVSEPGGDNRTVEAESSPLPGDEEVAYRAQLAGLELDATYTYRAVLDGTESSTFAFQTPPPGDTDRPVRITAFGDQGVPADPHPDRADGDSPIQNTNLAASLDPDVHLLAGDISYADGDPAIWDIYFRKNEPLWATTPVMTVPGNHEREAGQGYAQYDARLTMPEADEVGRWWTVQVGNVQVVGLNSDTICAESQAVQAVPIASYYCGAGQGEARQANEDQLAFVEETLAAAEEDESVDWTVVTYHNPTYSTGSHGSNPDVQALWVPLFEEHGVDVVLNGDDHLYQRTRTLVDGEPADEGPVYIVNGLGGSDTYEFEDDDPPDWEAHRFNDAYGTVVLDAYEDRLEGRFVTLDGTTVDPFTLVDGAQGPPSAGPVEDADDDSNTSNTSDPGEEEAQTPGFGAAASVLLAAVAWAARGPARR